MKKRNFKNTRIGLSILLSATVFLILQPSGGGRLTASDSDEPMTEAVVSSRAIAEHPPVEIVEKRDDHTRVWEILKELEMTHPDGSRAVDTVKSYIHQEFPQKFELYGQHELRIGPGQGFSSSKCGLTALQKGFDAIG